MMARAGRVARSLTRMGRARSLIVGGLAAGWVSAALAQSPPSPPPSLPAPADDAGPVGPDDLRAQLKKLEEMNKTILQQYENLSKKYDELNKKFDESAKKGGQAGDAGREGASGGGSGDTSQTTGGGVRPSQREARGAGRGDGGSDDGDGGGVGGAGGESGGAAGGASQTTGGGAQPPPREAQDIGNRRLGKIPLKVNYNYGREGFQFESENEELQLRIRAELQADAMIYQQANQNPVNGGFYLPRTRFYFQGYLTRPVEYQISFQRSLNTIAPLNVYLNFHYDDRLQFRIGRFKVPYLYEWYHLNNWRLIAPERSLFALNFQPSRQVGLMGWGQLFDKRMEYAVGAFDGPRNSFQDFNGAKNVDAFLNFKPFEQSGSELLQNLNVGGSVDYGYQNNPLVPAVLRTNTNASSDVITSSNPLNTATIPFLAFNSNVREQGLRALWDLHLAYYYKGLSLLGSWSSGFDSYSQTGASSRPLHLPVSGYYAQVAYLLTGETINDRVVVEPLRRFDLRSGKFGLGAFEVHSRFSQLNVGNQVFTQGFADPNLWTNQTQMVDVGVNWYLNKWVKILFDWEHAMFAQPVYYRPGPGLQKTSDLFWFRFQVYF